jgi:glucarate dehydratase
MLISQLKLHPVAIADAPLRSSYGLHAPYALRTIVELRTTDGLTGIGETYGGDRPFGGSNRACSEDGPHFEDPG